MMQKLTVFDDDAKIATITIINGGIFIFARSKREWNEMNRLVKSGYDVEPDDSNFLGHVAKRAHSYNYSTELVND